jgi:hypothetical protein
MGAFVVNFHVRGDARDTVERTVAAIGVTRCRVSEPRKGWVSIYEQRASSQDDAWIRQLGMELSSRLRTACVAFLVHDSDIACYWLSDQGQLLDEYNSSPDYFDAVSAAERQRVRGQADVFLRYCQPYVTREQIETVLRAEVVFAEDTIQQLAEFLGIDPERALQDFKDHEPGGRSGGARSFDGGDDDGDDDDDGLDGGPMSSQSGMARLMQTMQQRLGSMFVSANEQANSPESNALVQAAASGNIGEIDRLVEAGTDVNAPGLLPLEPSGGASPLPGLAPKVALSPLMAAASRGKAEAVQRLLELGADVNEVHPLYGSALHCAAQGGSPETVRILLAAGIPANTRTRQGHTPLAFLQAMRKQIEMTRTLVRTMPQLQQVYDQVLAKLEGMNLPEAGWNGCEELLRQAGG